jgi:2-methylcitrate dehydratase PrpD
VYFKPYSSCRWSHAAIDGLIGILRKQSLEPAAVERVTVHTFERALRLNNYPDPDTLEAAQYSIPFCLGTAAVRGPTSLLPLRESLLHDPDIVRFAGRVNLRVDAELDKEFPTRTPARVVVESGDRRFEQTVWNPKGDPVNPMTIEELEAKFDCLVNACMVKSRRRQCIESLRNRNSSGMRDILLLLRS